MWPRPSTMGLCRPCSPEGWALTTSLYSSFCTEFVKDLVKWLRLSEVVLPTMTAFASGLGGEGANIFAQTLLQDPILKGDPSAITQVGWPLGGSSQPSTTPAPEALTPSSRPRGCCTHVVHGHTYH